MSKHVQEITNLSTAVHDLLQGAGALPDATHRNRVFKTVKGMLEQIDVATGALKVINGIKSVVASEAPALAPANDQAGAVTFSAQELLKLNIAILNLPRAVTGILVRDQVYTVGDLSALRKSDLDRRAGIGEVGADIIVKALERFNLAIED